MFGQPRSGIETRIALWQNQLVHIHSVRKYPSAGVLRLKWHETITLVTHAGEHNQ